MIREISSAEITNVIADLCQKTNYKLTNDMTQKIKNGMENEKSEIGKKIFVDFIKNLDIAQNELIPICQDTGMAVVYLKIGQDVHVVGESIVDAVNNGVKKGYEDGYLRKSVVSDPIERNNTGDNTPAVIHTDIVPGNEIKITVAPKGFGSENMSKIYMLKPADGIEGVENVILQAVQEAGPNACPPMVIGIGIGGTFEKAAEIAKEALLQEKSSDIEWVRKLEDRLLKKINMMGIGPAGLGGRISALAVYINTFPTHIAGLPVAVNICCHVNRHASTII
jgi:fumarate hydratase subunit alpha